MTMGSRTCLASLFVAVLDVKHHHKSLNLKIEIAVYSLPFLTAKTSQLKASFLGEGLQLSHLPRRVLAAGGRGTPAHFLTLIFQALAVSMKARPVGHRAILRQGRLNE
jgi:hypothetical protein